MVLNVSWPCFICGNETKSTEGHGSSPWICRDDILKLMASWYNVMGQDVSADEYGLCIPWDKAKELLDKAKYEVDMRETVIRITDLEKSLCR